jgi:hypothetical protein
MRRRELALQVLDLVEETAVVGVAPPRLRWRFSIVDEAGSQPAHDAVAFREQRGQIDNNARRTIGGLAQDQKPSKAQRRDARGRDLRLRFELCLIEARAPLSKCSAIPCACAQAGSRYCCT